MKEVVCEGWKDGKESWLMINNVHFQPLPVEI